MTLGFPANDKFCSHLVDRSAFRARGFQNAVLDVLFCRCGNPNGDFQPVNFGCEIAQRILNRRANRLDPAFRSKPNTATICSSFRARGISGAWLNSMVP